jgi:hypothetical protein
MIENIMYLTMHVSNGSTNITGYEPWLPLYNMDWAYVLFIVGIVFLGFWFLNRNKDGYGGFQFFAAINMAPQLAVIGNFSVWTIFGLDANPTLAMVLWVLGLFFWFAAIWGLTEPKQSFISSFKEGEV